MLRTIHMNDRIALLEGARLLEVGCIEWRTGRWQVTMAFEGDCQKTFSNMEAAEYWALAMWLEYQRDFNPVLTNATKEWKRRYDQ